MISKVRIVSESILISYKSHLLNMTRLGNEKTDVLLRCHLFNNVMNWDLFVIITRCFMITHIRTFAIYIYTKEKTLSHDFIDMGFSPPNFFVDLKKISIVLMLSFQISSIYLIELL